MNRLRRLKEATVGVLGLILLYLKRTPHTCPSRRVRVRLGDEVLFNADMETMLLMLKFTGVVKVNGWAEVLRMRDPLRDRPDLIVELGE